jgi:OOP family OmpA-OmpF porin
MKNSNLRHALCALLIATPFISKAQDMPVSPGIFNGPMGYRTWSVGINGGALAPVAPTGGSNDFTKWKADFGYGAYVKYQILHALAVRADYVGGRLKGDNDNKLGNGSTLVSPYKSFETKLKWSASLSAVATIANINWLYRKNFVQIYLSAGGGIAGYSPRLTLNDGTQKDFKTDGTVKELIIPIGAGLKFKLTEMLNLDLGYTINYTDGDNLDGYYHGPNKDKYSYGYAGLEFSIGKQSKPQLAWSNPAKMMYDDLVAQKVILARELEAQRANNAKLTADVERLSQDSDGDGVSDVFDKCPNTPTGVKVDGSGCPLPVPAEVVTVEKVTITDEDRGLVNDAIRNLEFATGKYSILPSSYASLDRLARMLIKKGFNLKLSGYTDNVGKPANNLVLSRERANAVKEYLVSKGVNPNKIEAVGYGQADPIASNKTKGGRQKNRRVEFKIFE